MSWVNPSLGTDFMESIPRLFRFCMIEGRRGPEVVGKLSPLNFVNLFRLVDVQG